MMMNSKDRGLVESIIKSNFIMSLGSVQNGEPRMCIVFYVTNDNKTLYFKSRTESDHSKSFADNPIASGAIYHPDSNYSVKSGVQMIGKVERVRSVKEMTKAVKMYGKSFKGSEKKFEAIPTLVADFVKSTMYKFTIDKVKFVDSTEGIHTVKYERY